MAYQSTARTRQKIQPNAITLALQALMLGMAIGVQALPVQANTTSQNLANANTASPNAEHNFSIQAGTLSQTLDKLAQTAGINLSYDNALVEGIQSSGLQGRYTVGVALQALLAPADLEALPQGNGGYTVLATQTLPEVTVSAGRIGSGNALPEVVVTAGAWDSTTEGTGSYTQTGPSSTATGLGLTLRETPQSVTVVTRQKMDDFSLNTLEQVMEQTPGISIAKQGDQTIFYSRGEEVINFQTNGNRQQTYSNNEFTYTSYSFDDLSAVDRVEVLKGSSGLLTGDGYPSATINRILKKPTEDFQAHIAAGAGSWSNFDTTFDVSGPLNEDKSIRSRLVASARDGKSYKDYVQNKNLSLYGTVDIDLTPSTLLNIGVDYKRREAQGNAWSYGARAYDTEGNFQGWTSRSWNSAAPWSGYKQNVLNAFASLEHRFDSGWNAKLQLNDETLRIPENYFGVVGTSAEDLSYTYVYTRFANNDKTNTKNISLNLNGPFEFLGRQHELMFGLDYSRYNYEMDYGRASAAYLAAASAAGGYNRTFNYIRDGGAYLPEPDAWDTQLLFRVNTIRRGAYAAGRFNLSDNLKFIAGARVSDYIYNYSDRDVFQGANDLYESNTRDKGIFTPYYGLVYDLSRNFSFYGSAAKVFQPVTVKDELGRILDPKEGVTYEIGSKSEFYDGRLNVGLAYYWKRWENTYEASGGTTPTGDAAYRNINGAMDHGYELELSGQLAPGWQAQGSYSVNRSSLASYVNKPKQQFKLSTTYSFNDGPLSGFTVGANARWQSKTRVYHNSTYETKLKQNPYWVFDLMARYRFDRHWSASLNVSNVFDKKYKAALNWRGGGGEYYNWGTPRSVYLNVRYDF